ncbi:hypothetical protein KEM52_004454 [Ascosphaera acerosa]|nr:hypothetical protein KEM52_004454 [Ascosphaera acerosa]
MPPLAPTPSPVLPAEKVFPIQIGSRVFRLSGASIMSDAPLYIDRDPEIFAEIARHLQGYYIQPSDGVQYARLFADAQFYSLPRLTAQLFESDIAIEIGFCNLRVPRSLLTAPNNSPNYFTHAIALSFASTEQVFPGLERNGLLRPPAIRPLRIDNRDPEIFNELLRILSGYDVEIRDEAHRSALLRDSRYYQFRGVEQKLIPHEIGYNLARRKDEITLRLDHIKRQGLRFARDGSQTGAVGNGDSNVTGRSEWVQYSRPSTHDAAYELVVQIDGGGLVLDTANMRLVPHGALRGKLGSFVDAVKRRFNESFSPAGSTTTASMSPGPGPGTSRMSAPMSVASGVGGVRPLSPSTSPAPTLQSAATPVIAASMPANYAQLDQYQFPPPQPQQQQQQQQQQQRRQQQGQQRPYTPAQEIAAIPVQFSRETAVTVDGHGFEFGMAGATAVATSTAATTTSGPSSAIPTPASATAATPVMGFPHGVHFGSPATTASTPSPPSPTPTSNPVILAADPLHVQSTGSSYMAPYLASSGGQNQSLKRPRPSDFETEMALRGLSTDQFGTVMQQTRQGREYAAVITHHGQGQGQGQMQSHPHPHPQPPPQAQVKGQGQPGVTGTPSPVAQPVVPASPAVSTSVGLAGPQSAPLTASIMTTASTAAGMIPAGADRASGATTMQRVTAAKPRGPWIINTSQWRVRVRMAPTSRANGSGSGDGQTPHAPATATAVATSAADVPVDIALDKVEVTFVAVKIEAFTGERGRNKQRRFLGR